MGVLIRMTDLYGAAVVSEGTQVGRVADFLVDLDHRCLRYLCLALPEVDHLVALPMAAIAQPSPEHSTGDLAAGLTRQEVHDLAAFDLLSSRDRDTEEKLHHGLHWMPYWQIGACNGESKLQLGREVIGLHVQATDGPIGHLADLLLELGQWAVSVLVLSAGEALGRDVVLAPIELVTSIDWVGQSTLLEVTRQQIDSSAVWDQRSPYTKTQLDVLRDHFAAPRS